MDHERLTHLALSDNGFLFDTSTGRTYTLNKTGVCILKLLIEGKSQDKITEALVGPFEITTDAAHWDTDQFMMRLDELGVLTYSAPSMKASTDSQP